MSDGNGQAHTRGEQLRHQLEEAIMRGELAPGQRLDEQELAQRFRVSRTPVREALRHLASSGLIEMRARQGAVVAMLTIPRLIEMFQVMAELEGLCARLAARRITAEERRALEASHQACVETVDDPAAFYEHNRTFHEIVYAASRNRFLEENTRALRNRVAPYRRYITYQPGRMAETVREHGEVLDAIRRGDGEAAHRVMRDHVTLLGDGFADFVSALPASHAFPTPERAVP